MNFREDTFSASAPEPLLGGEANSNHQTDSEGAPKQLSDYEIERNKPMPNAIHGKIQGKITGWMYKLNYDEQFDIDTEISLDLKPGATPDILIYPKRVLVRRETPAKAKQMPITAIEIISPSQSLEEIKAKFFDQYFPNGVKSAWLVMPALKAISIFLPDGTQLLFEKGTLHDPVTDIKIPMDKIFETII